MCNKNFIFLYFLFKFNFTGDRCVYVPINQVQDYTALEGTENTADKNYVPSEINDKSNNYIFLFIISKILKLKMIKI